MAFSKSSWIPQLWRALPRQGLTACWQMIRGDYGCVWLGGEQPLHTTHRNTLGQVTSITCFKCSAFWRTLMKRGKKGRLFMFSFFFFEVSLSFIPYGLWPISAHFSIRTDDLLMIWQWWMKQLPEQKQKRYVPFTSEGEKTWPPWITLLNSPRLIKSCFKISGLQRQQGTAQLFMGVFKVPAFYRPPYQHVLYSSACLAPYLLLYRHTWAKMSNGFRGYSLPCSFSFYY